MGIFTYRGRMLDGDLVEGELEAASSSDAADKLCQQQINPITIMPKSYPEADNSQSQKSFVWRKISTGDLMIFSRQMYTLSKAGVPLNIAIADMGAHVHNKHFKKALLDIKQKLDEGHSLSYAMNLHLDIFPAWFPGMMVVGEATGKLEQIFYRLTKYLEFEDLTSKKIRKVLRYPLIVLITMAIAVTVINIYAIPHLVTFVNSSAVEFPWTTKFLIAMSDFFVDFWPHMLIALVVIIFAWINFIGSSSGRYFWDKYKLKIPVIGRILLLDSLSRFARVFSTAQVSGLSLTEVLDVVKDALSNAYIADKIALIRERVQQGESLSVASEHAHIFTPLVLEMIRVGEDSGSLDLLLVDLAEYYEREVLYEVERFGDTLEPIIITILAAMVLFLALAVYFPLWGMRGTYL